MTDIEKYDDQALMALGKEIMISAVNDYRHAYCDLFYRKKELSRDEQIKLRSILDEVTHFFKGRYIEIYSFGELTNDITQKWPKEVRTTIRRERMQKRLKHYFRRVKKRN